MKKFINLHLCRSGRLLFPVEQKQQLIDIVLISFIDKD